MIVHLKKGLPAPPRDWSRLPGALQARGRRACPGRRRRQPPYGIDGEVQRALAELRTDLDAFSDDEAYALMAAGYAMTRFELAQALPDPPPGDPELEALASWPFAATLTRLGDEAARGAMLVSLVPGQSRFFRRFRRWRMRRAAKSTANGRAGARS